MRAPHCGACHGTGRIIWRQGDTAAAKECPWCYGNGARPETES